MNNIFLFLHRKMIEKSFRDGIYGKELGIIISREDANRIVNNYLKYIPKQLRKGVLGEMIRAKLIQSDGKSNLRLINHKLSESIKAKILKQGNIPYKQKEKGWWD